MRFGFSAEVLLLVAGFDARLLRQQPYLQEVGGLVGEGKAVEALEPAVVGLTTVGRLAKGEHGGVFRVDGLNCRQPARIGGGAAFTSPFK